MSVSQIWDVSKYARYIDTVSGGSQSKGEWKSYEGMEKVIKLAVLPNHLMLSGSANVLESFSLLEAHTHVRGVRKGDSLLIVYKMGEGCRRFRVRFQSSAGKSGYRACSECHTALAKYFPWKNFEAESESSTQQILSQTFSSQMDKMIDTGFSSSQVCPFKPQQDFAPNPIPISSTTPAATPIEGSHPLSELAEILISQDSELPNMFAGTNYPTDLIRYFIQACLTDPSFPGFVKAVQEELNILIGPMDSEQEQNSK